MSWLFLVARLRLRNGNLRQQCHLQHGGLCPGLGRRVCRTLACGSLAEPAPGLGRCRPVHAGADRAVVRGRAVSADSHAGRFLGGAERQVAVAARPVAAAAHAAACGHSGDWLVCHCAPWPAPPIWRTAHTRWPCWPHWRCWQANSWSWVSRRAWRWCLGHWGRLVAVALAGYVGAGGTLGGHGMGGLGHLPARRDLALGVAHAAGRHGMDAVCFHTLSTWVQSAITARAFECLCFGAIL